MYILALRGHEDSGAYAHENEYGEKILYMFENEDDAERFSGLLEAEDYPEMSIVEIDKKVAIHVCKMHNYKYCIITPDEIVVPPRDYDNVQED